MNDARQKVEIERTHITGVEPIPTIIVRPRGVERPAAVINLHGYTSDKENHLEEAVLAAAEGITVVNIDARAHGARARQSMLNNPNPWDFYQIVAGTVADVGVVADYLLARPELCNGRLGMKGGSMGGYIALATTARDSRFDAILSICGGADYSRDLGQRFGQFPGVQQLTKMAAELDPINHLNAFFPRRLMLMHGEHDEIVPYAGQWNLYRALSPHYVTAPDHLAFVTHPGGHATPLPLMEMGWRWLIAALMLQ